MSVQARPLAGCFEVPVWTIEGDYDWLGCPSNSERTDVRGRRCDLCLLYRRGPEDHADIFGPGLVPHYRLVSSEGWLMRYGIAALQRAANRANPGNEREHGEDEGECKEQNGLFVAGKVIDCACVQRAPLPYQQRQAGRKQEP